MKSLKDGRFEKYIDYDEHGNLRRCLLDENGNRLRDKDGNFNFPKENVIPNRVKRTYNTYGGVPKVFNLEVFVPAMIEYRADGYSFEDIAGIYGCSHTTIRRFIREYYEKRTN